MVWKAGGALLLVLACAAVFAAYLRPDMVVTLGNAFIAFCGF